MSLPHRIEYLEAWYHVRRISRLKKYDRKNQHGPIVDPLYRNTRGVVYSDETGNKPGKTGSAINPNNNKNTLKTISQKVLFELEDIK